MAQFEFETKEEREAWDVLKPKLLKNYTRGTGLSHIENQLDEAAARFDKREKTCGIVFGSFDYGLLVIAQHISLNVLLLRKPTLKRFLDENGNLNDEGRAVLAALNEECGK